MNEFLEQFTKAWDALSLRQKASLFVSAGLTVVAVLAVVWWARLPTWAPLQTGLDAKDAQVVIQELQAAKIKVNTADGGATIEVPIEMVDQARRLLASKDLPAGVYGSTDDLVIGAGLGESSRTIEYRLKRSLESRLARTLEEFTWIRHARVHLTLGGNSPFVDDKDVAKASVQLTVLKGFQPTSAQAQGVVNTVRDSVPELVEEHISVVDQSGRPIVDGQAMAAGGGVAASRQLEIKNAVERDINKKIASVLVPLVGMNGYAIRTDATLDHQKTKRFLKTYDPDRSVLISESKSKEKTNSGRDRNGGGAPGTATNLPGGQGVRGGGTSSSSQNSTQQNSYQPSFEETTIEEPSGTVERLSVSVVVNHKQEVEEGKEEASIVPRSEEEMQQLDRLIKAAMGFDEQRGDVLVLAQQAFQPAPVVEAPEASDPLSYLPLVKWPALVVLSLVAFFLFYKPTLKTVQSMLSTKSHAAAEDDASAELERQLQIGPPSRLELMRQRLAKLAAEEPEGMAQTMRVWLNEEAE